MTEEKENSRNTAHQVLRAGYFVGSVLIIGIGAFFMSSGLDIFVLFGLVAVIGGLFMLRTALRSHQEMKKAAFDPTLPYDYPEDDQDLNPDEIRYVQKQRNRRVRLGAPKTRYGGAFQVLWSMVYFPLVVGSCVADMQRMTTADSWGVWRTLAVAVGGLAFYFYVFRRLDGD